MHGFTWQHKGRPEVNRSYILVLDHYITLCKQGACVLIDEGCAANVCSHSLACACIRIFTEASINWASGMLRNTKDVPVIC